MEVEKAFAEERAVWWTLEERGTCSANASPRGSLTGARALRRGDFASQRSVSGKTTLHCTDVTHIILCTYTTRLFNLSHKIYTGKSAKLGKGMTCLCFISLKLSYFYECIGFIIYADI